MISPYAILILFNVIFAVLHLYGGKSGACRKGSESKGPGLSIDMHQRDIHDHGKAGWHHLLSPVFLGAGMFHHLLTRKGGEISHCIERDDVSLFRREDAGCQCCSPTPSS
jgi:hypothetical protein